MSLKKVVIFGDSVLKPVIINEQKRYSVSKDIDWEGIENALSIQILNRSRMGATIKHGLSDMQEFFAAGTDCFAAIIEYGGNDCDYYWEQVASDKTKIHPPKTSPEDFQAALYEMINIAKRNNVKPILMTLPPISAIKYYNWFASKGLNEENLIHHLKDVEVISRHQESYNNMIAAAATRCNVEIVDVRQSFLLSKDYMSLMCEDGIHPNENGHRLIVSAFIEHFTAKTLN